ncbi:hypothetical protein HDZ31DRAFT_73770 [Schizophyllum fasciatum]
MSSILDYPISHCRGGPDHPDESEEPTHPHEPGYSYESRAAAEQPPPAFDASNIRHPRSSEMPAHRDPAMGPPPTSDLCWCAVTTSSDETGQAPESERSPGLLARLCREEGIHLHASCITHSPHVRESSPSPSRPSHDTFRFGGEKSAAAPESLPILSISPSPPLEPPTAPRDDARTFARSSIPPRTQRMPRASMAGGSGSRRMNNSSSTRAPLSSSSIASSDPPPPPDGPFEVVQNPDELYAHNLNVDDIREVPDIDIEAVVEQYERERAIRLKLQHLAKLKRDANKGGEATPNKRKRGAESIPTEDAEDEELDDDELHVERTNRCLSERIEALRCDPCVSFFAAHHVFCAGCGKRFATDMRWEFYFPALWNKHKLGKCKKLREWKDKAPSQADMKMWQRRRNKCAAFATSQYFKHLSDKGPSKCVCLRLGLEIEAVQAHNEREAARKARKDASTSSRRSKKAKTE